MFEAEDITRLLRQALDPRDAKAAAMYREYVARSWPLDVYEVGTDVLKVINQELTVRLTAYEAVCLLGGFTFCPKGGMTDVAPAFVDAVHTYWWDSAGIRALILSRVTRGIDSASTQEHVLNLVSGLAHRLSLRDEYARCNFKLEAELGEETLYCYASDTRIDIYSDQWGLEDPHWHVAHTVRIMGVLVHAFNLMIGEN